MENKGQMNAQEEMMQGLMGRYLKVRSVGDRGPSANTPHLDTDSLAAFTEGNLSELESRPLVSHLVECSFCRHITGELIRLDLAFADSPLSTRAIESQEPSKVSAVLNGLLSKIFGTSDGAVFAHNEDEEDAEKSKDLEADDSKEE